LSSSPDPTPKTTTNDVCLTTGEFFFPGFQIVLRCDLVAGHGTPRHHTELQGCDIYFDYKKPTSAEKRK
jgi:hypothetical protein